MWFKNIRAYRLTKPFGLSGEQLGQKLTASRVRALCEISGCVTRLGSTAG